LECGGVTPEQFCYWLQGFSEVAKTHPTPEQWIEIQNHLKTVFNKITPAVDVSKIFWPNPTPFPSILPQEPLYQKQDQKFDEIKVVC
jgi:hypothetical protein